MKQKYNKIWEELNDYLKGFIFKQVKDSIATDDILQEVFLKVSSKIDTLNDETKLSSWVFQIARNAINDYFRNRKKLKTDTLNFDVSDILPSESETLKLSCCVRAMIATLPEKYREAIRLSEIEGLSQKDLAKQLDISYSGAKSRVQRGREKLKTVLLDCCSINADKYGNIIEYREKNFYGKC